MKKLLITGIALLCVTTAQAVEHDHGTKPAPSAKPSKSDPPLKPAKPTRSGPEKMWMEMLARKQVLATSVAFDASGRLWRVRAKDRHVLVDRSTDLGKTFGTAVAVNAKPEAIGADGDSRPKIAIGSLGTVYVSWTRMLDKPFSGDVRFARSLDDGKTFSAPITVNDNHEVIGHRFDALALGADGRVYLAWLDKRDSVAAKVQGAQYAGSALYYAVSGDGGASFSANTKLADHSCDCCRVALAAPPKGAPVAFWRHVYEGNVRDHAVMELKAGATPVRVSHDEWQVEACPHHGPALAIAADAVQHYAWFDNAPQAKGLFYAQSIDGGSLFSAPLHFGNDARQPGHADVLSLGRDVYLAWKEFDGENSTIQVMRSRDGGATWGAPQQAAATRDASDHPQLAAYGGRAFLSWNTHKEGYRLIALEAVP
ncbi:MAG: sialidase family protein [Pseudomonadota bacterium]